MGLWHNNVITSQATMHTNMLLCIVYRPPSATTDTNAVQSCKSDKEIILSGSHKISIQQ